MPPAGESLSTGEKVERSVRRTLGNWTLGLLVVGVLSIWTALGFFTLKPGEAAVMLRLGRHVGTLAQEGLHWALPPPLVTRQVIVVSELRNEDFGLQAPEAEGTDREQLLEATMQTSDNNIVRVPFAVQFRIKDAFLASYSLAEPGPVVRDAAQAAMREVVGRMTVDGVLRERRAEVTASVLELLQSTLDAYQSGLEIQAVQLQNVQPPAAVRDAFDEVIKANQDASRLVNEAEGYRNEFIPKARAEAAELLASAQAYRDVRIAEATGEAERFRLIVAEHRKAPAVTEKRLYLETMEQVLPKVEKVIIEPGTTQVLPYLPLGRSGDGRAP